MYDEVVGELVGGPSGRTQFLPNQDWSRRNQIPRLGWAYYTGQARRTEIGLVPRRACSDRRCRLPQPAHRFEPIEEPVRLFHRAQGEFFALGRVQGYWSLVVSIVPGRARGGFGSAATLRHAGLRTSMWDAPMWSSAAAQVG